MSTAEDGQGPHEPADTRPRVAGQAGPHGPAATWAEPLLSFPGSPINPVGSEFLSAGRCDAIQDRGTAIRGHVRQDERRCFWIKREGRDQSLGKHFIDGGHDFGHVTLILNRA